MQLPRRSERLKRKREQQQILTEVKHKKCGIKKQRLEEPKQRKDIKFQKQTAPIYNRYQEERKISLRIRLNNKLYKIENLQMLRRRLQDICGKKSYVKKRAFI